MRRKNSQSRRVDPPPSSVPPGRAAFAGSGAFYARQRLKTRGARWDPEGVVWHIAEVHAEWAWQQVLLGEKAQVELDPDDSVDPDVGPIPKPARIRCFECGTEYSLPQFMARPGSLAAEWYCGCAEAQVSRLQSRR